MKSKRRKRVIASVLCMVLMLSTGMSTLAEADAGTVPAVEETTAAQTTAQETKSTSTDAQTAETETQTQTETENQTETKQTEEAAQTKQEETTAVQPTEEASGGETTQTETDQTAQNTQDQTTSAETSGTETQNETVETQPEETETTTPAEETQEMKEEASVSPAFSASIEAEDKSATVYVSAEEGVFPEGTTVTAKRIDGTAKEYDQVEKSLNSEIAKSNKDVLDFVAYDITFRDEEGNEIEPEGEVQVSLDFHDMELGGASKEDSTVSVIHVKDDFSTETVQSDVDLTGEQLKQVEFKADEFSIYAVTAGGKIQEYTNSIENPYATIEFWDKNKEAGDKNIEFKSFSRNEYNQNGRYLRIEVYVENGSLFSKEYQLDMEDDEYSSVNLQTSVRPGDNYYLQKCVWQKAGEEKKNTFGGSGNTGMNKANKSPKVNTLQIYLSKFTSNECTTKISGTKNISVDLYNYDIEAYNSKVGLNSNSLLLRSTWGNYKSDGYMISGNNAHNESCGKTGIYYGLVQPNLNNGNIVFNKFAKFFDAQFDTSVGTKYSNANFEFIYNENSKEYSYNSEKNHVHFNENTNTISQYEGIGPNVLPDGSDLTKHGFFPFTNEADNMIDYGFGMKMNIDFQLLADGTIDGSNAMTFSFSGDDDVWVFIDGQLVLDLGGLHSRRGGTIDFHKKEVRYDKVTYKDDETGKDITSDVTPVSGEKPELTKFWEELEAGEHTLTMYYLERGGNDSNCEIKFNLLVINREGELKFNKIDSETKDGLSGVSFSLYDTNQINSETQPIATTVSDSDGKVIFDISGLDTTKTYYLKEDAAPFGYQANDAIYTVKLSEEKIDTTIKVTGKIYKSDGTYVTSIENIPKETTGGTTAVTVKKNWVNGIKEVPIELTLYANGQKVETPSIENPVTLNSAPWEWTWENLPGDTEYTVQETVPDGYKASIETEYQFDINIPYEEIKACNWLERELGENGVVAIKKGNSYFVWTTVELNDIEKQQLLSEIRTITNGFDDSNTNFQYGSGMFQELDGTFNFDYNDGKLKMSINASNAWSWLLLGTYTKTVTTTITNSISDETIDIPVTKEWKGDPEQTDNYNYVTVQLYQNGTPFEAPVKIYKDSGWKYTFTDLPYYSINGNGEVTVNDYTVKETEFGLDGSTSFQVEKCEGWLKVEISKNEDGSYTITNAIPDKWFICKVSSTNHGQTLEGAEFTLTKKGSSVPNYYGKSFNPGGVIKWWDEYANVGKTELEVPYISDGEYILEETKAPGGYSKNEMKWEITIENLILKNINDSNGPVQDQGKINRAEEQNKIYLYENTPLYELPSAGGPGIFGYTIGGVLLLMAGTLILYKLKDREVLKK